MRNISFPTRSVLLSALLALGAHQAALADPRQDYYELAQSLSNDYRLNNTDGVKLPQKQTLERLVNSKEAGIQRSATLLMNGLDAAEKDRLAAKQRAEDQKRNAADTLAAIDRGAYKRKEEYYDYDERGNLRKHEYEIDESLVPFAFSFMALYRPDEPTSPELEALKLRIATDRSRARAWDESLPGVAEQFAGPLSAKPLVTIQYLGEEAAARPEAAAVPDLADTLPGRSRFRGRFVARNAAGRDLHNVTLAVEMFHFSTLPEATLRHVYFVPLLKKDAVVEFSRTFIPDVKRGGGKYHLEVWASSNPGYNDAIEALSQMQGVVRMRSTVWCDEARQAPTFAPLPERANYVAKAIVGMAEACVMRSEAVTPPNAPAPANPNAKTAEQNTQAILERILPPVRTLMPADSALALRAEKLLKDFKPLRDELLAQSDRELLEYCAPGKRYTDVYYNGSRIGILFLECDSQGRRIRAEVFEPSRPERRCLVAGFIATEAPTPVKLSETGRWIMLEPVSGTRKKVRDIPADERGYVDDSKGCYRFTFYWDDPARMMKFIGQVSKFDILEAGRDYDIQTYWFKPTATDPQELAAARKRNLEAPQEVPREPFQEVPVIRTGPQKPSKSSPEPAPAVAEKASAPEKPGRTRTTREERKPPSTRNAPTETRPEPEPSTPRKKRAFGKK